MSDRLEDLAAGARSGNVIETGVEVMRDALRHACAEERKSHRVAALDRNRAALGEIQDKKRSWNKEVVIRKAKLLKKKPLPIEDYLSLQSALIQDATNTHSFMSVGNILFALVRDLSGANPALQLVAANCCCNIALVDSRACNSVAKTAGPYLVAQLDTMNYPLVEVCIWTIGNLAGGSESAFQALWAQGCLKRLFSLLGECEPVILPSVFYAIKHCLWGGREIITDSEMMDLTRILIDRNWSSETETLWLLALVSSREACTELLLAILPGVFDLLCATLQAATSDVKVISAAIRLLANTVSEPTGSAADAIQRHPDEKLKAVFEELVCHPQNHVRSETVWLLANLYNHSLPRVNRRLRDFIVSMMSLQRSASSDRDVR